MHTSMIEALQLFLWKMVVIMLLISIAIAVSIMIFRLYRLHADGIDWAFSKESSSGVIFGKRFGRIYISSQESREGHVCILGPSGSGKTSSLLIPTLRNWKGTSFSIDIAGDMFIRSINLFTSRKTQILCPTMYSMRLIYWYQMQIEMKR